MSIDNKDDDFGFFDMIKLIFAPFVLAWTLIRLIFKIFVLIRVWYKADKEQQ
jgi:hypothetical protein